MGKARPLSTARLARRGRPATSSLDEVQRRIMGIETEFGVTCTFHGHRRLSPDEVARYLFRRVVSWGRTRSRPIINPRDEPHAAAEKYRRLHVIVGDSNMCESTTMLKVGSASLVLEMIEAGVPFRDFSLDNPIRAIREVSHDLTGRRPVRLAGGRQASALDIQREYYSRAVEHLQTREPNAQIEQVVDLWGRQLDAVESQDFAKVDTEIDR